MPGLVTFAASVGLLAVVFGSWKVSRFLSAIREYKSAAKGAAKHPPTGFTINGCSAARASELQWFVIDDQVMGGKSQSALTMTDDGAIEFAGTINTKGGGFSSCRTLGDDEPLGFPADAQYIEIDVVGDGHQYKLTLHTADSWSMRTPAWAHDFHTGAGEKRTFRFRLQDFLPTMRGQVVQNVTLDAASITGIGINLSLYTMQGKPNPHFGDGPFSVRLERVSVVS
eukprot:TRINITY_DN23465_c0_g1_i1.p1 TRINITY_DN23465_c0_g1~~TRINITY_DN23465_c0_g1_i1.p1  ORF type:complete len:226 (-),score=29.70 TRINITY_DN23465_c0_g1_i1:207-884(-)